MTVNKRQGCSVTGFGVRTYTSEGWKQFSYSLALKFNDQHLNRRLSTVSKEGRDQSILEILFRLKWALAKTCVRVNLPYISIQFPSIPNATCQQCMKAMLDISAKISGISLSLKAIRCQVNTQRLLNPLQINMWYQGALTEKTKRSLFQIPCARPALIKFFFCQGENENVVISSESRNRTRFLQNTELASWPPD